MLWEVNVRVIIYYFGNFNKATRKLQKMYLKNLFFTYNNAEIHLTCVAIKAIWKYRNIKEMSLEYS